MNMDEFKEKYEELKNNPMYQKYCSVLETKDKIIKNLQSQLEQKEKQLNDIKEYINGAYEMSCYTKSISLDQENIEDILDIIERNNDESKK